ncbi:unnamed protein product, partial [Allacma fusca]
TTVNLKLRIGTRAVQ